MSIRYDENTKARAVRLVREHREDYDSEWAAVKAVSGRARDEPGDGSVDAMRAGFRSTANASPLDFLG